MLNHECQLMNGEQLHDLNLKNESESLMFTLISVLSFSIYHCI